MGCGASSHVKDDEAGRRTTTAATHRDMRSRQSVQPKEDLDIGPEYVKIKHLGRGGTGDTWCFKHVKSGDLVAIKFIKRPLPKVLLQNIQREFTIQADLGFGHENVIQAYEAVLTPKYLCLVMEYASGGSLTSYVADKWQKAQALGLFLSEDEARYFFKQFLSAVKYCHTHCVAHRDLKLDNTLLDSSNPPIIKICDFGFAKTWSEEANMFTQIGTPVYMSPELINTNSGQKGYDGRSVDVWASGILLLVMLLGSFPFDHTEHPDPNTSEAHLEVWLQQVSKRWSEVPHMRDAVKKLTPECKDLLNRIFVIDATKRITISQIERHPWYNMPLPPPYSAVMKKLLKSQAQLDQLLKIRNENAEAAAQRKQEVDALVEEATHLPAEGEIPAIKRIDLRQSAVEERTATLARESLQRRESQDGAARSGDGVVPAAVPVAAPT